jgi:hypothetical protein
MSSRLCEFSGCTLLSAVCRLALTHALLLCLLLVPLRSHSSLSLTLSQFFPLSLPSSLPISLSLRSSLPYYLSNHGSISPISSTRQVKILRMLRMLGSGDREATDAMSDILAQVREPE